MMKKAKKIKVFLVDDHAIFREGLKHILSSRKKYEILGEAADGKVALEEIDLRRPDIVILDISLPTISGIEIALYIKKYYENMRIVILTRHDNQAYIHQLLKQGIHAYVLKDNSSEDLLRALEEIGKGRVYLSPQITNKIVQNFSIHENMLINDDKNDLFAKITPREREVLKLLSEGKSNKDIAKILRISAATVKTHRINIMRKLSINNIADLVMYAVKVGLVET